MREGILDRDPLNGIKYRMRVKKYGPTYAPEMIDVLRVRDEWPAAKSGHSGSQVINIAMLDVLAGTSVRSGELIALCECCDVDRCCSTAGRHPPWASRLYANAVSACIAVRQSPSSTHV